MFGFKQLHLVLCLYPQFVKVHCHARAQEALPSEATVISWHSRLCRFLRPSSRGSEAATSQQSEDGAASLRPSTSAGRRQPTPQPPRRSNRAAKPGSAAAGTSYGARRRQIPGAHPAALPAAAGSGGVSTVPATARPREPSLSGTASLFIFPDGNGGGLTGSSLASASVTALPDGSRLAASSDPAAPQQQQQPVGRLRGTSAAGAEASSNTGHVHLDQGFGVGANTESQPAAVLSIADQRATAFLQRFPHSPIAGVLRQRLSDSSGGSGGSGGEGGGPRVDDPGKGISYRRVHEAYVQLQICFACAAPHLALHCNAADLAEG